MEFLRFAMASSIALILAAILFADSVYAQDAEVRLALVIGNKNYNKSTNLSEMPQAEYDRIDVANALRNLGFEVTEEPDLTEQRLRLAIEQFARKAKSADWAVIYYSGHGYQVKGGWAYMIPVDSKTGLSVAEVMQDLDVARKLRIIIFDACRLDPEIEAIIAASSPSLKAGKTLVIQPKGSEGTIVAFASEDRLPATAPNGGRNSYYTAAFLANLKKPGLDVRELFENVATDVRHATKDNFPHQVPMLNIFLQAGRRYYFNGNPPAPPVPDARELDAEQFSWAQGNLQELERYVRECKPPCAYRSLAISMVASLRREQSGPAPRELDAEHFSRAQGSLEALERYINECKPPCLYKSIAISQATNLRREQGRADLYVCNYSDMNADVALLGKADQPSTEGWIIRAWIPISSHRCIFVGRWAKGVTFYHAREHFGRSLWEGSDRYCVSNKPIAGKYFTSQQCPEDEVRNFVEFNLAGSNYCIRLGAEAGKPSYVDKYVCN